MSIVLFSLDRFQKFSDSIFQKNQRKVQNFKRKIRSELHLMSRAGRKEIFRVSIDKRGNLVYLQGMKKWNLKNETQ